MTGFMFMNLDKRESMVTMVLTKMLQKRIFAAGSTKKAEEIAEAANAAYISGCVEGLEGYCNQLRADRLSPIISLVPTEMVSEFHWDWVPMVSPGTIYTWWLSVSKRWKAKEWENVSDTAWYAQMNEEFMSLVFDREFKEHVLDLRKRLIRAGVMDPEAEDREWIREELEAMQDIVTPIQTLAEKAGLL